MKLPQRAFGSATPDVHGAVGLWIGSSVVCLQAGGVCSLSGRYWDCPRVRFVGERARGSLGTCGLVSGQWRNLCRRAAGAGVSCWRHWGQTPLLAVCWARARGPPGLGCHGPGAPAPRRQARGGGCGAAGAGALCRCGSSARTNGGCCWRASLCAEGLCRQPR